MEPNLQSELYDEYMDHDALSCLEDYNRYEENQLDLDAYYGEYDYDDFNEYDYDGYNDYNYDGYYNEYDYDN